MLLGAWSDFAQRHDHELQREQDDEGARQVAKGHDEGVLKQIVIALEDRKPQLVGAGADHSEQAGQAE